MNLRELNGCDNMDCSKCYHYVGDKMCSPLCEIQESNIFVETLDLIIRGIEKEVY